MLGLSFDLSDLSLISILDGRPANPCAVWEWEVYTFLLVLGVKLELHVSSFYIPEATWKKPYSLT